MTITKISALALAALVAGAAASPVLALDHSKLFDDGYYLTQLRYDGINAIAANAVTDETFQATVVLPNGNQVFELFDRDSLQQIK
ncbi:MAG TPA: hypothetical protein VHZ56_01690 [Devosia sp.]|jgi:hypothetical protein|nr:hypothetical protein [Devosia sp.]